MQIDIATLWYIGSCLVLNCSGFLEFRLISLEKLFLKSKFETPILERVSAFLFFI